jgi:hypothetical protein
MPRMKRLWLVLVLLFAVTSSTYAEDNRRDGNWWREQPQSDKLAYMVGFFDGIGLGRLFTYWHNIDDKNCSPKIIDSFQFYSDKFLKDVTNSQLVDGLDVFYKDYRNRKIRIHDAVWLTLNAIAGTPQGDLDKMTDNFRKNAD